LFSLKILPPDCNLGGGGCPTFNPALGSMLNLNIENVFTPASVLENSIGFQTLADGYTTLTGSMNIGLKNVFLKLPDGTLTALTKEDAGFAGEVGTNGDNVELDYGGDEHHPLSGWLSAWTAAQGYRVPSPMNNASIRMIVRPTLSGTAVRVKIENILGQHPATFSAVYIGKVQSGAAVVPGSNKQL